MNRQTITFRNGRQVCPLGMGTWLMGDSARTKAEEIAVLRAGIELGMTVIDTAEMYGDGRSETLVGEAIRSVREQAFVISKVLPSNASRDGIRRACERSLRRLQTDRIDLYLLHWRGRYALDETVEAMTSLQRQGKIGLWGVSNLDTDEMDELFAIPEGSACAADEILYNLTRRGAEHDLLPWCAERSLPAIAYSPIEQGRLLGNRVLNQIAERHSATPTQIALAWVLRMPGVLAIPKASTVEHLKDNAGARSIRLSAGDLARLDEAFPAPRRKIPLEMI